MSYGYSPATVRIHAGDWVKWTNANSLTHSVTYESGPAAFDSGAMASGTTYETAFNAAGMYRYRCAYHGDMMGTVQVSDP